MAKGIKVGPGIEGLKPAGHSRREQLKKRVDNLAKVADGMMNATDAQTYAVDPDKLREEPEILKHLNFSDFAFEVTRPVAGKVYFWCWDKPQAVAMKRTETRMWLGAQSRGWEIVGNCSCSGNNHPKDCIYPEALELKEADGRRLIGDVFLMRMDLDEYTKMHKRTLLVQKYRESNVPEPMAEWVKRHEGIVTVRAGNKTPQDLYKQVNPQGGPLVHGFTGKVITSGEYAEE